MPGAVREGLAERPRLPGAPASPNTVMARSSRTSTAAPPAGRLGCCVRAVVPFISGAFSLQWCLWRRQGAPGLAAVGKDAGAPDGFQPPTAATDSAGALGVVAALSTRPAPTTSTLHYESEEDCPPPKVAFVVPFYSETESELRVTLESITGQKRFMMPVVIVVSDDGGPAPERPQAAIARLWRFGPPRQCISAVLIRGPNGGLAVARNRAIASLPPQVEWILNVDTGDKLDRRFLDLGFRVADARPDVHVVHPHLCYPDGNWDPPNLHVATDPLHKKNLMHCCPMFQRSVWEKAGGYDASFRFGWEDWDFWVRANMTVGLHVVNLKERCLYSYSPGGLHQLCQVERAACMAAFASAHGNLNTPEETVVAHGVLLRSAAFLREKVLRRSLDDTPLLQLWTGLLHESTGDAETAVRHYKLAAELDSRAHRGLRLTRGVGWQAAYRGRLLLEARGDAAVLASWCQDMLELLVGEAGVSREGAQWRAVRCDPEEEEEDREPGQAGPAT